MRNILRKLKRFLINNIKKVRRIGLKNKNYTIVSNNCTGGYIYQYYGMSYKTPTVGLFFYTKDFIKLCKKPRKYFNMEINFIDSSESIHYEEMKDTNNWGMYPCGILDDIEVYFMHYSDKKEAYKKWKRRCDRINYDNIIFMFTENESCSKKDIEDFCMLPLKNKICLTYNKYNINGTIYSKLVNELDGHPWKPEIVMNIINWKKYLNKLNN
ncbi:DUF1919 domain-containing protein [Thomasclavelia sp.]